MFCLSKISRKHLFRYSLPAKAYVKHLKIHEMFTSHNFFSFYRRGVTFVLFSVLTERTSHEKQNLSFNPAKHTRVYVTAKNAL
jgi:hypothetical protein